MTLKDDLRRKLVGIDPHRNYVILSPEEDRVYVFSDKLELIPFMVDFVLGLKHRVVLIDLIKDTAVEMGPTDLGDVIDSIEVLRTTHTQSTAIH